MTDPGTRATTRVALIHATPAAMEPIAAAMRTHWPEAETMNILDDSLATDRARNRALSAAMYARFGLLTRYAIEGGAYAILFTCSAFGPAIDEAARQVAIPVLKPNTAMFEAALARGKRIGMVATFAPAVSTMTDEFAEASSAMPDRVTLQHVLAPGAMDALRAGDAQRHDALVADAAASLRDVDVVMLAHFSTARALPAVQARVGVPVLTAPDAAVIRLRALAGEAR